MKKLVVLFVVLAMVLSSVPFAGAASYRTGDILYAEDFSGFNASSLSPYGCAAKTGAYRGSKVVDGALVVDSHLRDSEGNGLSGRYGTRIELYAVPANVDKYSISVDICIDEAYYDSNAVGSGLLLADNGVSDANRNEKKSEFSMFWMRLFNVGATGA